MLLRAAADCGHGTGLFMNADYWYRASRPGYMIVIKPSRDLRQANQGAYRISDAHEVNHSGG